MALGLLAAGVALGAPAVAGAVPGATIDLADVGGRPIHLASTFTSDSLVVTNTSTAGEMIAAVEIDLADGPAMFPDLVFDPVGGAGDTQGKDVTLDSVSGAVVLAAPPAYGKPLGGGYSRATITFPVDEDGLDALGDFAPGSAARFSFDVDPTSIQGTAPEPVPAAAPVSGAELHGATVAVTFSDGSVLAGDLVLTPGTDNSSHLTLAPGEPLARPALARAGGRAAPAVTFDPAQQVVVSGPAGASGVMVVAEGHLNVVDAPGGGTDLDPFEANTAAAISEVPFTIGADGTATVAVTLSDTPGQQPLLPLESGIDYLTAYLTDGDRTGPVSDPLVIQLDPQAERVPPALVDVVPIADQTRVRTSIHPRITFSEPMDPGTVLLPGAVTLTGPSPPPVTLVPDAENRSFELVPLMGLVQGSRYTLTVNAGVADTVGNVLSQPVSWSFMTEDLGHADPLCALSPGHPICSPPPTTTGPPACAEVPERRTPEAPQKVALTAARLRTDQRIAQAALRRAAAIEAWLDAGIQARDLCGNGIGPAEFAGLTFSGAGRSTPATAAPRALAIPVAAGTGGRVTLTVRQMRVNQRIARAALRLVDALTDRLDGGLTGGDLADATVESSQLWNGLRAFSATQAAPVPPTVTTPRRSRARQGRVTLSAEQAFVNRRIAVEALRRVDELADRLARGLTGADFRDGSLTVLDLAPGVRPD
ncbi:MAG: hypothetical protein QOD86_1190 [Miltoncostaeaceae bacterium]|nr:hypothetical protein [Miltoncostaeaceae bacterium]